MGLWPWLLLCKGVIGLTIAAFQWRQPIIVLGVLTEGIAIFLPNVVIRLTVSEKACFTDEGWQTTTDDY